MSFSYKFFWILLGFIALSLGIIGIFLPLLPTTPFLLLASGCFMRGSQRLHQWLITHPSFGPFIIEWQEKRTIRRPIKIKAMLIMMISFTFSISLVSIFWVKCIIAVIGVVLLMWFSRIKST